MKTRETSENLFAWIGRTSAQNPWLYIFISCLLLTVALWQLQFLTIDTTTEGFFKADDPALATYNQFKDEFGRDVQFIVAVESNGIFTPAFIRQFSSLHDTLATRVPYVDQVNSLINARDIFGQDSELVVQGFFDEMPKNDFEWADKADKAITHPLYRNIYISSDGTMANIYIRPDVTYARMQAGSNEIHYETMGKEQIHEMMAAIRMITAEFPGLQKNIHIAGAPVLSDELSYYLVEDMLRFVIMAIAMITIVLFLLFRSLWGILLPLTVVLMALISTLALMSTLGQPLQSPTVILPSFILAVGISDAIHLLSLLLMRLRGGDSKPVALEYALRHCGVPIFFTILTTAAGLFSFGGSEILPVANLGWFSAAGVFFAFLYTIILLPALIAITPIHVKTDTGEGEKTWIDAFIAFSLRISQKYTVSIVCCTIIIAILSVYGALQLSFSHDPVKWLPQDSYGRQSIEQVSKKIGGTVPVEIVIDTGESDGIKNATFMHTLDEAVHSLENYKTEKIAVGKVLSVTTLLKETNKALLDNSDSDYVIPDSREEIAQEFLLLETSGADDLFRLVDNNYQKARITVLTPWIDALYFGDYIQGMETMLQQKFAGQAEIHITGAVPMLARTIKTIMQATALSYAFAFIVITVMMMLLLRSVKYGLISIIPNVLPITVVLALMHLNGAPLDMFSMLIGSIALGLAIDDTVHFMDGFRQSFEKTADAQLAISESLHLSGRAMLSTGSVLAFGFLIYAFSVMQNLQDFGMYTALCIVLAALADFWVMPALLLLLHRKKSP